MTSDEKPVALPASDPVVRLSRAFMESRLLLTGAELDLFTLLADQSATADALASAHGWQLRPLTIVLDALVALGLLTKHQGAYRCPPEVADKLSARRPNSILASVHHAANLWNRWSELTARVTGQPPRPAPESDQTRAFVDAMHVIGRPLAPRIVAIVKPAGARRLLDVGGASGTYTMAFLDAAPGLRVTLFDLPDVIPLARERLSAAGYFNRVTLVAGNYLTDPLPDGHDLAWLSAVIHSNGPEENLALYRRVYHALVPGGRIVIRDHVMNEDRTAPRAGALFAVNMLSATMRGRTYTYREVAGALTEAGFADVQLLQSGEAMDALVAAQKPT